MTSDETARKGKSHRLRQGRTSWAGHYYLITTRKQEAAPFLNSPAAADLILNALKWLEENETLRLEAAVIMPTHIHFVCQLLTGDLSAVMKTLKGFTAREINRSLGRKGSLWQAQYHDHAIRRDEVLEQVIRYCLENPVRAGLVEDFREYPYWYCRYEV